MGGGDQLDLGEYECLAIALTDPQQVLLFDEELAREAARKLNLRVRGTVGLLLQAWRHGLVSTEGLTLYLDELEARDDVWLSASLIRHAREAANRGAQNGAADYSS